MEYTYTHSNVQYVYGGSSTGGNYYVPLNQSVPAAAGSQYIDTYINPYTHSYPLPPYGGDYVLTFSKEFALKFKEEYDKFVMEKWTQKLSMPKSEIRQEIDKILELDEWD